MVDDRTVRQVSQNPELESEKSKIELDSISMKSLDYLFIFSRSLISASSMLLSYPTFHLIASMDLLDYDTDSSEEKQSDPPTPDPVLPSFVSYLENYSMNQQKFASAFPFLLCELPQAFRQKLRPVLKTSLKTVERVVPNFHKLYSLENSVDQVSSAHRAMGVTNTNITKKLHITLFPIMKGKQYQISQLENNLVRRMRLWSPPESLLGKPNVLSAILGDSEKRQLKLQLEPRLEVLTLKTPNVIFIAGVVKKTKENESLLKGLSSLIGEQADNVNLSYEWWKSVGVTGIDDCRYHVSFLTYNIVRPGTAICLDQIRQIQAALDKDIESLEDLAVDIDTLILNKTTTSYRRIPLT